MGILRLQFPALSKKAVRKFWYWRKWPAQVPVHSKLHDEPVALTYTQAERTGYVIRHQHFSPIDPCSKMSLYCGYGEPHEPVVSLHAVIPDMVPYGNSTDHVASTLLAMILLDPSTDGSKIMAAGDKGKFPWENYTLCVLFLGFFMI